MPCVAGVLNRSLKADCTDFNCKSETGNVCNVVEGHCLQAMKIVHHHTNDRFERLISEHQSVNPWREAISILSAKYKRFSFVHPVHAMRLFIHNPFQIH